MKNLKVKFAFFSLLTVLAVSVLLVSCEQKTPTEIGQIEDLAQPNVTALINGNLLLPNNIYDKGEEYQLAYLANLSEDMFVKLHNNYLVAASLDNLGKINEVVQNESYGFHFSDIDLSKYLSQDEVNNIETSLISQISEMSKPEFRGDCPSCCWRVSVWNGYEWSYYCRCWMWPC